MTNHGYVHRRRARNRRNLYTVMTAVLPSTVLLVVTGSISWRTALVWVLLSGGLGFAATRQQFDHRLARRHPGTEIAVRSYWEER